MAYIYFGIINNMKGNKSICFPILYTIILCIPSYIVLKLNNHLLYLVNFNNK